MSQKSLLLSEIGALRILQDSRVPLGSIDEVVPVKVPAPSTVADADTILTVDVFKTGVLVQTPTTGRTITLPTAANLAAFLKRVGDSVDITVINLGADTVHITLAAGTGGSIVGSAVVRDSSLTTNSDTGSAVFKVRQTNVTSGAEAYVCYRVC